MLWSDDVVEKRGLEIYSGAEISFLPETIIRAKWLTPHTTAQSVDLPR